MSAWFPAWRNSSPSMSPTRRMGEDGYLAAKGLITLPGDCSAEKITRQLRQAMAVLTTDGRK